MDRKIKKNYIIYALMLIIFGALIYFTLTAGKQFISHGGEEIKVNTGSPLIMFFDFIKDNLHHPLSILLIQITAVLLMVRLFGYLFNYIGQPGVIGEIVAGIVLGPSVLGYFYPDVFNFLFPASSLSNLELLSQVGLVLFMFVIGMELDFGVLKNKINETLVISHAGILVPFFLGIVSSYWIYEEYASSHTPFLPFALFIGISMSITAFPVLARILQERKMTKTQLGTLTIASAANDDVTAWCLLAIVIAITQAGTFASALYSVAAAALYIVIMFLVVRPFLKKIGEIYVNQEVINKTFVAFILLILIISSCITEIIGIHALFGAFMAGVVMPSNLGFRKVMMEKVEDISLVFFLPLFFAYTGLRTEIGLINSVELWGVCLLLIAVAVLGKLGGCAIASRLVGESWKDSLTIGTLMNTRGLMELVALNIGYEMGVLPPSIFVILVIMALVTTFMTTPLLHFVERFFARREEKLSSIRKLAFCFGNPHSGKTLLSIYNLIFGKELKKSYLVAAHFTVGTDVSTTNAELFAKESFAPVNQEANKLGVSVENVYGVTDKLVQDMISFVQKEKPNMLLLGTNTRPRMDNLTATGVALWLSMLKDRIHQVVEQVDCPVGLFINHNYREGSNVSVAVDSKHDLFLLPYVESILSNNHNVRMFLFEVEEGEFYNKIESLRQKYPTSLNICWYDNTEDLTTDENNGIMIISSHSYSTIASQHKGLDKLPSLLIIREYKA